LASRVCYGKADTNAKTASNTKRYSIKDIVEELEDSFAETLFHYIDARGLTDPEVYKRANLDRKLFSKIRKNRSYQPSKTTALALAIALKLSLDETKDFIAKAGYALTHSSKADLIVEYFITKKEYDVFKLNEVLFEFGEPLLGSKVA
jgi:transcriptional regulator with XRE-family HTH domain